MLVSGAKHVVKLASANARESAMTGRMARPDQARPMRSRIAPRCAPTKSRRVAVKATRVLLTLFVLLGHVSAGATSPCDPDPSRPTPAISADVRVQRLHHAMGGRERWAALRGVHIEAMHYEAGIYQPYANRLWVDFEAPRMRFEAESAELGKRVRAVVGDAGWRLRDGAILTLTPEQVASDRDWYHRHVYRTVHRLAARDDALCARVGLEGRVEVVQADGSLLLWIRQAPDGSPIAFGTTDATTGTVFGPLENTDGLRVPAFVVSSDGGFRALIRRVQFDPDFTKLRFDKP